MRRPGYRAQGGSASVYGPDLLTGDDSTFDASAGNWVAVEVGNTAVWSGASYKDLECTLSAALGVPRRRIAEIPVTGLDASSTYEFEFSCVHVGGFSGTAVNGEAIDFASATEDRVTDVDPGLTPLTATFRFTTASDVDGILRIYAYGDAVTSGNKLWIDNCRLRKVL